MQRMKRFLTGLIAALLLSPSAYAEGTESFGIALGSTSFQEFAGKYPAYFSKGKSGCEDYLQIANGSGQQGHVFRPL